MRILVTGAPDTSAPCSCQAAAVRSRVTVLDNSCSARPALRLLAYDTFDVVRGDARDEALIKKLLAKAMP